MGSGRGSCHRTIGGRRLSVTLVLFVALAACGSDGTEREDRAGGDTTAKVTTTEKVTTTTTRAFSEGSVELPFETGSVIATDSGMWVFPHLDAAALRVSSAGEVDLQIDLPAYVTAAASGDGMLWARTERDEQSYSRIDPESGSVLARVVDVPGDQPIVAFGFVWAVGADGTLFRIDPRTNGVDSAQVQPGPFFLSKARGKVWTLGPDGLVGVDPTTLTTTTPWRPIEVLGHRPEQMATTGENLLFATPTSVAEVDPEAHTKIGEAKAPEGTRPLAPATSAGDEPQLVWAFHSYDVAIPDPPRGVTPKPVTIARLDFTSGSAQPIAEAPFPEFQGMALSGDTLWVSPLREKRVVKVELGEH